MTLNPFIPTENFCAKCAFAAHYHILPSTTPRIVCDSVARTAIRYGIDGPGFDPQILSAKTRLRPALGQSSLLQWVPGLFPGVTRPGRG
jgi:hypothetical protein